MTKGHISLIIFRILINSSLGNVFDSVFWSTWKVILPNCIYMCVCVCVRVCIYLCISNTFQRSYEIFFSHANFFSYSNIFRILSVIIVYLLSCNSDMWHKSSRRKVCWVFWSTKCNPLHKFSFDVYVTFSNCSVDKTERNSSGRAKGKDNEYTKVSVSIQESVWGYNGIYA